MSDLLRLGIRYPNDAEGPWAERLLNALELFASHLEASGERFFLDTTDSMDYRFGDKVYYDLYGWIVPEDQAGEFIPRWLDGENADQLGEFVYAGVTWEEGADGDPVPVVDRD